MAPGPIGPTPGRPGRRHNEFWPSQLRVFRDCPERYFRTYIARERVRPEFSRALQRGSAVHKALAAIYTGRKRGEPFPSDLQLIAARFLPRFLYERALLAEEWHDDLALVVQLVAAALDRIPAQVTVLQVEETVGYVLGTRSIAPGAELRAKVDLLVRHPEDVLEHIEFKTGAARPDPFQDVICRIGVVGKYRQAGLPILSTTMQLSTGEEFNLDGDRSVRDAVLPEIEGTIRAIWDATAWPARECDACRFCEYRTTLCSIHGEWGRRDQQGKRS
jgi:hypothetical protein